VHQKKLNRTPVIYYGARNVSTDPPRASFEGLAGGGGWHGPVESSYGFHLGGLARPGGIELRIPSRANHFENRGKRTHLRRSATTGSAATNGRETRRSDTGCDSAPERSIRGPIGGGGQPPISTPRPLRFPWHTSFSGVVGNRFSCQPCGVFEGNIHFCSIFCVLKHICLFVVLGFSRICKALLAIFSIIPAT